MHSLLRHRHLLLLFVFGFSSCSFSPASRPPSGGNSGKAAVYTGLWIAPETDKTFFELDLTQNGSVIQGYHAALIEETGSIEAALRTDHDVPSIQGEVRNDGSAVVRFRLRKAVGEGEAVLTLRGDRLKWRLISATGAPVLPKSCNLLKQAGAVH